MPSTLSEPFAPPAASRHYGPDRPCDLRHVRLDISVDPAAGEVTGTAVNLLVAARGQLSSVTLDAAELTIESAALLRGAAAEAAALGEAALPPGSATGVTTDAATSTVTVQVDPPLAKGEVLAVILRYRARPRGGMYFTRPDASDPERPLSAWTQGESEDNRYWFPSHDSPDDHATGSLFITTRPPLEATATGQALPPVKNPDGSVTWRFRSDHPHATYLNALVIGEFDLKTADWNGVRLEYRVMKGRGGEIARSFAETPKMLDLFSEVTGVRYPHDRLALNCVPNFVYGGMENLAAVTLTDRTLHDARAHLDSPSEPLIAHEVAHQWFGDMVGFSDWSEAWLSEGLASFLGSLWTGAWRGPDEYDLEMRAVAARYFASGRTGRAIVTKRYRYAEDLFDSVIYGKGNWVMSMLRRRLGDEAFRAGLKLYIERNAWRGATTEDLRAAMETASGRNLERFFDEWVLRPGHPKLTASWAWDSVEQAGQPKGEARLLLSQKAVGRGSEADPELFDLQFDVEFLGKDGTRTRRHVAFEGESAEVRFPCEAKPAAVLLDPELSTLMEVAFDRADDELRFALEWAERGVSRVDAAAALGDKPATDPNLAALGRALREDKFRGTRQAAAASLGTLGALGGPSVATRPDGSGARDLLMGALVKEPDSRVRTSIAAALGRLRDDEIAGQALARALVTDDSYAVRAAAASGLAETRPPEAFESLASALKQSSNMDTVLNAALGALAELHDPRAGALIRPYASLQAKENVRARAATALAVWAREREPDADRRWARETLEALAADSFYNSRSGAVSALGTLGEPAALPLLDRIAKTDFDNRTRAAADGARAAIAEREAERRTGAATARSVDELKSEQSELKRRLESLERRKASEAGATGHGEGEGKGPPAP